MVPTRLPRLVRWNEKVIRDTWSTLKLNVVPIVGVVRFLASTPAPVAECASLAPESRRLADCLNA
jgi:hypothetical protein